MMNAADVASMNDAEFTAMAFQMSLDISPLEFLEDHEGAPRAKMWWRNPGDTDELDEHVWADDEEEMLFEASSDDGLYYILQREGLCGGYDICVRSPHSETALTIAEGVDPGSRAMDAAIARCKRLCASHLAWHLEHDAGSEDVPKAFDF